MNDIKQDEAKKIVLSDYVENEKDGFLFGMYGYKVGTGEITMETNERIIKSVQKHCNTVEKIIWKHEGGITAGCRVPIKDGDVAHARKILIERLIEHQMKKERIE